MNYGVTGAMAEKTLNEKQFKNTNHSTNVSVGADVSVGTSVYTSA